MEERLKRVRYQKRNDIVEGNDCSACAYAFTSSGDTDDRLCRKHNVYVGAFDICDCFEDWAEVTEEGREFKATIQKMAEMHMRMENAKKEVTQNSEGCYIATAVYGGYDMPEVLVLRKFRDKVLKKNFLGRTFIKVYYALSPSMAEKLKYHDKVNKKVKYLLDKFVEYLRNNSKLK